MNNHTMKLSLKNFRGATKPFNLEFDSRKQISFIFGENGSGKSTIVDALSFLFLGDNGSLAEISGAGYSNLVSIGANLDDLEVALDSQGSQLRRRMHGRSSGPLSGTAPFTIGVLRRSQILQLVTARPADRYSAVKEFFEIPNVQKAEDSLRKALKTSNDEFTNRTELITTTSHDLKQEWKKAGSPGNTYLKWAEEQSAIDLTAQRELQKLYNGASGSLAQVTEEKDSWTDEKDDTAAKQKLLEDAEENLKQAQQSAKTGSEELLQVLQKATAYFDKNRNVTACPVCGSSINVNEVAEHIKIQIQSMETLATAIEQIKTKKQAVEKAQGIESLQKEKLLKSLRKAHTDFSNLSENSNVPKDISAIAWQLAEYLTPILPVDVSASNEQLNQLLERLANADWESKTEKPKQDIDKIIQSHDLIADKLKKLKKSEQKAREAEKLANRLHEALSIYEGKRKAHISGILDEISGDVNRLYQVIHPKESIGNLQFVLSEKTKGSLDLSAQFHTRQEVKPQAYYSESHLDTLGICIFIALAKKNHHEMIVLDDVLTSVDSAHFERFIELLDMLTNDFKKIIITTHSRTWIDRYRHHSAASQNVQLIKLDSQWDPDRGMFAVEQTPQLDVLRNLLVTRPFDRQDVAAKSGILLECIFDQLALKYKLKLPRKKGNDFTLGEYLGSVTKKLKSEWRIECDTGDGNTESTEMKPLLDDINSITWIRNQVGAHFNVLGQEVSYNDVKDFAQKTIAFAEALICPESGDLPLRDGNSFWTTKSKKKRMYPHSIS